MRKSWTALFCGALFAFGLAASAPRPSLAAKAATCGGSANQICEVESTYRCTAVEICPYYTASVRLCCSEWELLTTKYSYYFDVN